MDNFIFVFFAIFATTVFVYLFYKLLLSASPQEKEEELQITTEDMIKQLKILYQQRSFNIVENLAKSYLAKKPKNIEVRMILAKTYFEEKKYFEAIDQAVAILNYQPAERECKIFLANCYETVGKSQQAISIFRDLLDFDSEDTISIKNLARLFSTTNQKISAVKMYERLNDFLESNHEKAENMTKIAELETELREYSNAVNWYNEILKLYPNDKDTQIALILLYFKIEDYQKVIETAEIFSSLPLEEDEQLWILEQFKNAYMKLEDYDNALEYMTLICKHPLSDKVKSSEDVAKILMLQDQTSDGIEILKTLAEKEPDNINIKKDLASAYQQLNDYTTAVNLYNEILEKAEPREINEINNELSDIYASWGMSFFNNGDNEECFKRFTLALQYNNNNADVYFKLGKVNKEIKNFNEAISNFKHTLDLNVEYLDCYYELAECYDSIDSIYEQKNILMESLKYETENPEVYYHLGLIFYRQNDFSASIENMKKAIQLQNDYIDAKIQLALLYEHIGETDKAILLYEEVLNEKPENEQVLNNLKMLQG